MAETRKAYDRRVREGWFEKYAPAYKSGIDLGCGHDPLNQTFRRFDCAFGDGDAQLMHGTMDNQFHTVYCMVHGSFILTKCGFKQIQDVNEGDEVWTHKRRWRKVTKNNKFNPQINLIRVVTTANPIGIMVTKNHPIFIKDLGFVDADKLSCEDVCECPVVDYCESVKVFDLADVLKENELVKKYKEIHAIRKLDGDKSKKIGDKTLAESFTLTQTIVRGWIYHYKKPFGNYINESTIDYHSASHDRTIPRFVQINGDLMRLLGYFLADGSLSATEGSWQVGFHFNVEQMEYIDDVSRIIKDIFHILPTDIHKNEGKGLSLRYCCEALHTIFSNIFCSVKSHNKEIPAWALWKSPKLQMELIEGFFRGDGTRQGEQIVLNTVSRKLAEGLRLCLLRNNIFAALGKTLYDVEDHLSIKGCGYIFGVRYREKRLRKVGGSIFDNKIYTKIRRIENVKESLEVYGLEVQEDESYYASSIMHHNSSHLLEHVVNPIEAVFNWFRICRSPGHVIICVPHRDLYEKKKTLPSNWNGDHKTFWLPENGEGPVTMGLRNVILQAVPNADIVSLRVLDEGWVQNGDGHSGGEYSIEAIIKK